MSDAFGFVSLFTAVSFVSTVFTVVFLIAGPAHGDAATAGTGKERRRTLGSPDP